MVYPQLLTDILTHNNKVRPQKPALYYKKEGHYTPITYHEVYQHCRAFASALKKLGIQKGDHVGLLSTNRPEWVYSDFGIMLLEAVNVPIYPTLSPQEVQFILVNANIKLLIVESVEKAEILQPFLEATSVKHVIIINQLMAKPYSNCLSFQDLLAEGAVTASQMESIDTAPSENDCCSIVYTSGTTGNPKGVLLTHKNFASNVRNICEALPLNENEVVLSFLPLSHVFERTTGYYVVLAIGGTIYYAESIDTVSQDLLLAHPTVLISVPRLFEKVMTKINAQLSPIKQRLFNWAQSVADTYFTHPTRLNTLKFQFADVLIFKKIKQKLGGNIRFMVSGGAPLNPIVAKFFHTLDIMIIEGYGLTESSPVIACNRFNQIKYGSIGKVLPNQEVKLGDDNELLSRGDNIMQGYLNLPDKTQEAIDADGWLHTGDIARIDEDGYIYIVDRKKDLIVLSNGKKVAPQLIESDLMLSPYISQVVVIGEKRNYITALIVPNLSEITKAVSLPTHPNIEILNGHTELKSLIQSEITHYLAHYAPFEKIKRFKLLPNEFTIDSGELTPSMKPKRAVIRHNYQRIIDAIYDETQDDHNDEQHDQADTKYNYKSHKLSHTKPVKGD